jgi:hypothetical protein
LEQATRTAWNASPRMALSRLSRRRTEKVGWSAKTEARTMFDASAFFAEPALSGVD